MAKGFAVQIFGSSHQIESAGAETATGDRAASAAIAVMAELGIDISSHSTVSISDLDLSRFDLVVVFRPSAAVTVHIPSSTCVEYLDVPDPYGHSIEGYRTAARSIRRGVRRIYAGDAVRRLALMAEEEGSHVAGVFNRAASELEKELRDFARADLGLQVESRATLGQVVNLLEGYSRSRGNSAMRKLANTASRTNRVWVKAKHGDTPAPGELMAGLKATAEAFKLLERLTA